MSLIIRKIRFTNRIFAFLCCVIGLYCPSIQGQNWNWIQQIGGEGSESCDLITTNEDGSIYASGSYNTAFSLSDYSLPLVAERDIYLAKLDDIGNVEWVETIGSIDTDETKGICTDREGNIYWSGSYWVSTLIDTIPLSSTGNSKALFLAKYNDQGKVQWAKSIAGSAIKIAGAITSDTEDNIYLTGSFEDSLFIEDTILTANGAEDLFITKFNSNGVLQWIRQSGLSGQFRTRGIKVDHLGEIFIGGVFKGRGAFANDTIKTNTTDFDVFTAKYDSNGLPIWGRKAGGVHEDDCKGIDLDEEGNLYVTGHFLGVMRLSDDVEIQTNGFNDNFFLLKYQSDGTPLWARSLGNPDGLEYAEAIIANNDSISLTGYFSGNMLIDGVGVSATNSFDGFTASFNTDGTLRWIQVMPGTGLLLGADIEESITGQLLVAANFEKTAMLNNEELVAGGSFDGFIGAISQLVSSSNDLEELEEDFVIFPNPAKQFLNVKLENKATYNFSIINTLGQTLRTGILTDQIALQGLQTGLYILTIQNKKGATLSRTFFIN